MTSIAHRNIDVFDADDLKLVRFRDHSLLDEMTVHEVATQITEILPDPGCPIHLILDFSDVNMIASSLLSKLLLLKRRVGASEGTLRLCGMSPDIRSVFHISKLDRFFQIDSQKPIAFASC